MKVYLVEDTANAPGRIYAVMAHEKDAIEFANMMPDSCAVIERTLIYGQPSVRGYNP